MIIDKYQLFNVYREEANPDGGAGTTGVQTDDTDNAATSSTGVETESNAVDESAVDDTSENTGENTGEGSQTNPPETYADFNMPDDVKADEALLNEATSLFKELSLTQEQAQKLIDLQAKQAQASSQSQVDAFNQLMQDWKDQAQNDKEIGGDKFEENVKVARTAIEKFGTPELKQLLEEHGVGNHPEVIRFMVKVGRLTAEDVPGNSVAPANSVQDRISRMYPNDRNA